MKFLCDFSDFIIKFLFERSLRFFNLVSKLDNCQILILVFSNTLYKVFDLLVFSRNFFFLLFSNCVHKIGLEVVEAWSDLTEILFEHGSHAAKQSLGLLRH